MVSKRTLVFAKKLRRFFFTTVLGGIVVVLPIYIFAALIKVVFNFISALLAPVSNLLSFSSDVNRWIVDLLAFAIVIFLFFLIGLLVRTELGRQLLTFIEENWLGKAPFYTLLRDTVRQILGQEKMPFRQVVLVDVYSNDTLMTGFVVDSTQDGVYYTVFVPTAPNPTNGFIFHVKREQLKFLEIKTEDALRSVIALGTGSAAMLEGNAPKSFESK
ncbi:MAG: DUF502 domain-containing protein [Saprospiraceae bacterium]|nr:DUF502 domain-containing protein [Saprospiraceae bacterium]